MAKSKATKPTNNGHATNGVPPAFDRAGHDAAPHAGFRDSIATNRLAGALNGFVNNATSISRASLLSDMGDPRRSVDDECGYPPSDTGVSVELYKRLYDRCDVANRVVQLMPRECWKVTPTVYEDESADVITPFEADWDALGAQLGKGRSWHSDEEGSMIWNYLSRADILSRLGSFGVVLLGLDDGKNLQEPVDGMVTINWQETPVKKMVWNAQLQRKVEKVVGIRRHSPQAVPAMPDAPFDRRTLDAALAPRKVWAGYDRKTKQHVYNEVKPPPLDPDEELAVNRWAAERAAGEQVKRLISEGRVGDAVTLTDNARYQGGVERIGWERMGLTINERTTLAQAKNTLVWNALASFTSVGESLRHSQMAMPGYGQIFFNDKTGEAWYVGGDGDEREFEDVVKSSLSRVPGVKKVVYESESFPDGWTQPGSDWVKMYPVPATNMVINALAPSPAQKFRKDMGVPSVVPGAVEPNNTFPPDAAGQPNSPPLDPRAAPQARTTAQPPQQPPQQQQQQTRPVPGRLPVKLGTTPVAGQPAPPLEQQAPQFAKKPLMGEPPGPMMEPDGPSDQLAETPGRPGQPPSQAAAKPLPGSGGPEPVPQRSTPQPAPAPGQGMHEPAGPNYTDRGALPDLAVKQPQQPNVAGADRQYGTSDAAGSSGYGMTPASYPNFTNQPLDGKNGVGDFGGRGPQDPNMMGAEPPVGPNTKDGTSIYGGRMAGADQQYYGVQLGPSETQAAVPARQKRKVIFLRVFDESLVQVVRYEWNVNNPRFGMPVMYRVTLNDPREVHSGIGLPLATVFVHWSRLIHLADVHANAGSSDVFAPPVLRPVLNRCLDLYKLPAAAAEGYWQSGTPTRVFETHPQLGGDVLFNKAEAKDDVENLINSLQKVLFGRGGSWKLLAPAMVDPSPFIKTQIELICIQQGVPVRIFEGAERGQLASSQDDSNWNDRVTGRMNGYLTPCLICPFIDRLIVLGVLSEPTTYSVEWPDLESMSEKDKASIFQIVVSTLVAYVQGGGEALVPPRELLTKFLHLDEEEVDAILEAAAQAQEDALAEQQVQMEQQAAMLGQQTELQGAAAEAYGAVDDVAAKEGLKPEAPEGFVDAEQQEHEREVELLKAKNPGQGGGGPPFGGGPGGPPKPGGGAPPFGKGGPSGKGGPPGAGGGKAGPPVGPTGLPAIKGLPPAPGASAFAKSKEQEVAPAIAGRAENVAHALNFRLAENAELEGGRWVTTDGGARVYIKDGEPAAGNPKVTARMKGKKDDGGEKPAEPKPSGGESKRHSVALPKDRKRMNVDQADEAMRQMGIKSERLQPSPKTGFRPMFKLTHPDGRESTASLDEVKETVYRGFDSSSSSVTKFKRAAENEQARDPDGRFAGDGDGGKEAELPDIKPGAQLTVRSRPGSGVYDREDNRIPDGTKLLVEKVERGQGFVREGPGKGERIRHVTGRLENGRRLELYAHELANNCLVLNWDEDSHPRDETGKFTSGGGGGGSDDDGGSDGSTTDCAPDCFEPNVEADTDGDGVTDAARVGVPATAVPPPPPIGRLPNLTPHERAVEKAFIEHYENNPDQVAAEFRAEIEKVTKPGEPPTFGTDDAKVLSDAWSHPDQETRAENRATLNLALHQTANAICKRAFVQELDKLAPGDEILVTVGGCGSGKGFGLKKVPEALELKSRSKVVWDSAGDQCATENPWIQREAEARGLRVNYFYCHANPETQWADPDMGVVKRASDPKDGRMVDAKVFADSYAVGARNHQAFYEANRDNPNANFVFVANRPGALPQKIDGIPPEALQIDRKQLAAFAAHTVKQADAPERIKKGGTVGERVWAGS